MDQMDKEWNAWQNVVSELAAHGIDVNAKANERLVCRIRIWGEQLAKLRRQQNSHFSDEAIQRDLAAIAAESYDRWATEHKFG